MSGYDENLLKEAPEASRAERQKGYNIDLLVPDRVQSPTADPPRTPSAPPGPSFPPASGESEVATGTNGPGAKEYGSISQEEGGALRPDAEPLSFWRTTKGKLLIGLIALIVIAAIVGGAVGGATSSKGGSKAANPSTTSSPAPISSTSAWTSQPYASGGSTSSKSQPVGGSSVASTHTEGGGSGSETTSTNSNNAQGPSTSLSPSTAVSPTTTSIPVTPPGATRIAGSARWERGAADSSRDRRRHPPARGVAGAEVDD